MIAYGASLETETTFVLVEAEGKYEINLMSIQDFVSVPLGIYIRNNLKFGEGEFNLMKELKTKGRKGISFDPPAFQQAP
jgi:GTP-dependent phosphoenolpyruvate carboxykinase